MSVLPSSTTAQLSLRYVGKKSAKRNKSVRCLKLQRQRVFLSSTPCGSTVPSELPVQIPNSWDLLTRRPRTKTVNPRVSSPDWRLKVSITSTGNKKTFLHGFRASDEKSNNSSTRTTKFRLSKDLWSVHRAPLCCHLVAVSCRLALPTVRVYFNHRVNLSRVRTSEIDKI